MQVCAGGILLRDEKILLGKRSAERGFYPNVWDIIGGRAEGDEGPEQTLHRELGEEIGVIPTEFIHIGVLYDPEPSINGDFEYNVYLVTDWSGSPRNLRLDEHSELRWFEIDEALQLELAHPAYPELITGIPRFRSASLENRFGLRGDEREREA